MLSALAFTIIIGLFAANNNTKASVLERYPVPSRIHQKVTIPLNKSIFLQLKRSLQLIIFLQKYKFTVLKDTASKENIMLMKMSDYNAIAKQLKRPK